MRNLKKRDRKVFLYLYIFCLSLQLFFLHFSRFFSNFLIPFSDSCLGFHLMIINEKKYILEHAKLCSECTPGHALERILMFHFSRNWNRNTVSTNFSENHNKEIIFQLPIFSEITKYQAHVCSPKRMAEFTNRCFNYAMLERGPVQLNIPRDMFYGDVVTKIPAPIQVERNSDQIVPHFDACF